MIDLLMCKPSIVLKHIVIHRARCLHQLLDNRLHPCQLRLSSLRSTAYQDLRQMLVRDIDELLAVELRDHKLPDNVSNVEV